MTDKENSAATDEEEYLYHYHYMIDDKHYNYFDYFKNRQEAETTILFWNAGAPYIKTVSLRECKEGLQWRGFNMPYKRSEWKKLHNWQD
jgi:hypothetical protein